MTSCAPRLKKDNGPTWTSVSIHWTDSDMGRLSPVDGLPWIRNTDKAKLFNKNGPLRVVAAYRTTDGVDPKTEYRHVSMIADAIEQYVLVKIVMPKEVSPKPGADWPKFRVWAFLQPPIIGRDKKRRDANGGYVVDDIPRAGWFEAVVDGKTMTAEEIDYSKGHKTAAGKKPLKVTGERDASDPRVVRFKICARVANNELEAELKEKAQKLRKKNQDVSLVEAGSYLKVWVRNEERTWPQKPLDDDSEKIVQSMADSDSIKPGAGIDPRKFRNHTWKRSRLATHKKISGTAKDPDKALLYVGLYPAHVIEKIEKFETKIADVDAHEMNPGYWLLTMLAWSLLSAGARGLRTKVAAKQEAAGPTGGESPYVKATKQLYDLFQRAQLSELFASYAVAGYDDFLNIQSKMDGAQIHNASWFKTTRMLMDWILKFALMSDARSKDEHVLQKALELMEQRAAGGPKPKSFKDAVPKEMFAWARSWKDATFAVSANLLEDKSDKTIPKIPTALPLPGLWWLSWYIKLHGEAGLKASLKINAAKVNQGELTVSAGLEGKGKASIKIGLQGIWARIGEDMVKKEKAASPGPEGEMLQKILEMVNLELSLMAELAPSAAAELSWTFIENKNGKYAWKFNLGSGFSCPLVFNLSVFQWSYDTFNGKVWEVDKYQAAFFSDVTAFKKPKPEWATVIEWGESKYDKNCFTTANRVDRSLAAAFGLTIPLHLGYAQAVNPEKSTVSLNLVADTGVELATGIVVKHNPPSTPDGRGEIMAPLKMTWNPAANTKEPGVVSLHSLYATKWDKLAKALTAVASGKRVLKPSFAIPDAKPVVLSDRSTITLLQPKATLTVCRVMTQPRAGLFFQFNMDFYADSHIWVKLCEDDLLYDDVCGLKGTGKDNWRLYPLLGAGDLHSQREVFIPGSDLLAFGTPETAYQFYLRLALLDSNFCEIKIDSKQLLTVPAPTLAMIRKG